MPLPKRLEELTSDNTYARLPAAFFSRVRPKPLSNPHVVSFNPDAAALLDLDRMRPNDRSS